jgi:hypothetical protein
MCIFNRINGAKASEKTTCVGAKKVGCRNSRLFVVGHCRQLCAQLVQLILRHLCEVVVVSCYFSVCKFGKAGRKQKLTKKKKHKQPRSRDRHQILSLSSWTAFSLSTALASGLM